METAPTQSLAGIRPDRYIAVSHPVGARMEGLIIPTPPSSDGEGSVRNEHDTFPYPLSGCEVLCKVSERDSSP
jgi:hypothetical protein